MTFRLNNGFGTTTTAAAGSAVISPAPDNALQQRPDGLYVKAPAESNFTPGEKAKLAAIPSDLPLRLSALEQRPGLEGLIAREGVLIIQQTDGSEIVGPVMSGGVSKPVRYTSGQWEVKSGPGEKQITITIKDDLYDGGSLLTAIKYQVGTGALQVLTTAPAPGDYVVTMAQASALYDISILASNAIGDGPISIAKSVISAAPAQQAPSRVSDPVLSGSAVLGGTLTRQSPGVVTGNPPPEMGSPLWAMRANGTAAVQIIESASGETLSVDDAVFDVGHQIRTGTRFWNSQGEITLWSNWVEVAEVPQITAAPITMTAGQGFEITFNVEPDSVSGSVDLTVDPLDPRKYTGIADPGGETVIGATKAGHKPYSETFAYAPVVIVPDMTLIVEADQRIAIDHVDPDGDPFEIQINGQVFIIDPADFGPDQAPVAVEAPEIDGEGGDGEVLTQIGRAVFAGDKEAGAIAVSGAGWHRDGAAISGQTGTTYTQDEAVDGDKTLTWRETGTNDAGATVAVSNEVFCPAVLVGLPPDTFSVANVVGLNGKIFESGETWTKQVSSADAQILDGWLEGVGSERGAFIRGPLMRGPAQYATADQRRNLSTGAYRGIFVAVCVQQGVCSGYLVSLNSSGINLVRMAAGVGTILATAPYPANFIGGAIAKIELVRKSGGLLEAYVDGVLLMTATDTTYTDGGIGAISIDPTGSRHALKNFEARATR